MRIAWHFRSICWAGIGLLGIQVLFGCSAGRSSRITTGRSSVPPPSASSSEPPSAAPPDGRADPAVREPAGAPCDANSLLRDAARLEILTPFGLDAEIGAARASFERTRSDCDRFRLAVFSLGSESRRNDSYAADLMEEYLATSSEGGPLGGLAQVLLRAFREEIAADARLRAANRKLAEEQARSEALRRQVEELKNIEKIIKEREKR